MTVPTGDQVLPLSPETCQVPLLPVTPVTAIPCTALLSTSLIELPTIAETRSPLLPVSSSVMVVKLEFEQKLQLAETVVQDDHVPISAR